MKRQYILDGHIKFSPSDSTLTRYPSGESEEEPFLLPVPASRLLQTLLEQSPALSTREELLVLVWENYGMKGSIHNLAHYTMILRKAFSNLDMDKKVIVTVHKKGLMINPLLEVTLTGLDTEEGESTTESELASNSIKAPSLCYDDPPYLADAADNTQPPPSPIAKTMHNVNKQISRIDQEPVSASKIIRRTKMKRVITLAAITGLVALACLAGWIQLAEKKIRYSENNLRVLKKIDRCTLYTFNAPTNDGILIKDLLEKAAKYPLNCKKDRVIIYETDAFLGPNNTGKKFHTSLTVCTESKNLDDLNSCVSHYYN